MNTAERLDIVGFTPLAVILAERQTYKLSAKAKKDVSVTILEELSPSIVDDPWQSVSLLCLINLLKQCRMVSAASSKKYGVDAPPLLVDESVLRSYLRSATECVEKYYFNLLQQRHVRFKRIDRSIAVENGKDHPWYSYFHSVITDHDTNAQRTIYTNHTRSLHSEFDQSPRLNVFEAIFQPFLSCSSLKFIGADIFTFELAHLFSCFCPKEIFFYRMNANERPIFTNERLNMLFEVFAKCSHPPVIQRMSSGLYQPILHIIEEFHHFRINFEAGGRLEYERTSTLATQIPSNLNEIQKNKRAYLKTFRQRSLTKLSSSNVQIDVAHKVHDEPLDSFPSECTFFVLSDTISSLERPVSPTSTSDLLTTAIGTFHSTPSALLRNIYETVRTLADDPSIPQLADLFLSVDHELCVLKKPTIDQLDPSKVEKIIESPHHDLQKPVENLHDLFKITQQTIDSSDQFKLHESQVFQTDALDLQSLILLFDRNGEIPVNELIFLFYDEHEWCDRIVLPRSI